MPDAHIDVAERERQLDEAVAGYFEALEAGSLPNRQHWLDGFPSIAKELAAFLEDQDQVDRLAEPLRQVAHAAQTGPLPESGIEGSPPPQNLPAMFGNYELLEILGQGGMGVVYKARHKRLDRLVALKMIRTGWLATKEQVQRFQNEARTVAKLDHPNIVPIHEVGEGETNGQPFYTMKLVEGGNLAERIRDFALGWPGLRYSEAPEGHTASGKGHASGATPGFRSTSTPATLAVRYESAVSSPLSPGTPGERGRGEGADACRAAPQFASDSQIKNQKAKIVNLLIILAQAVHHAHQRGIIHRDLKPSNILLAGRSASGGRKPLDEPACDESFKSGGSRPPLATFARPADAVPYIADFGLAKWLNLDNQLTHTGGLVGTPTYMAPEQTGSSFRATPLTTAVDIYSLGAILYTLLTGHPPFQGVDPLDTLHQVRHQDPTPPRQLNRHVDRDLESICLKCLEKEPGKRYGSAEALGRDLERWQEGRPVHARPVRPVDRVWRWCKRNRVLAGLSAAVMVLVVGGIIGLSAGVILLTNANERETSLRVDAEAKEREASEAKESAQRNEQTALQKQREAFEFANLLRSLFLAADSFGLQASTFPKAKEMGAAVTARQILEFGAKKGKDEIKDPLVRAAFYEGIASAFRSLGNYDEAEPLAVESYAIRLEKLGEDNLETATSQHTLAAVRYDQGKYEEAECLFRKALITRQKHLGNDDLLVADTMLRLAMVLAWHFEFWVNVRSDEAENLFTETIRIRKLKLGPNHRDVGFAMGALGSLMLARGRTTEAVPKIQEALRILGNQDVAAQIYGNYMRVIILIKNREFEKALEPHERVLNDVRRVMGENHPFAILLLGERAGLLDKSGRMEEAEKTIRRALEMGEKSILRFHPSALEGYERLADRVASRKEYAEALTLYQKALVVAERTRHEGNIQLMKNRICDIQERLKSAEKK
jgi:serine/threonine protein kinase/tetratricopeptide (TPR) repeat protein